MILIGERRKKMSIREKGKSSILMILMLVAMALVLVPDIQVHAEDISGDIGDVDYTFTESDGKLKITLKTGSVYENAESNIIGKSQYGSEEKTDYPWNTRRDKIKTIEIIGKITQICDYAFADCINLESVTIPDTVKYIDSNAFENSGLESIKIPSGLKYIDNNVFKNCTRLKTVNFESYNPENYDATIWKSAFEGCTSLESITIPGCLCGIEDNAFKGCTSLKEVKFVENTDRPLYIDENAFEGCTSITKLELPGRTEYIRFEAFKNCSSLEYVNIKDSKWSLSIMGDSFSGCPLKTVYLPKRFIQKSNPFDVNNKKTIYHLYAPSEFYNFAKENGLEYEFQNGGRCGVTDETELKWYYDEDAKELVVTGNGKMADYPGMNAPWNTVAKNAEKITVEAGCANVGENAFYNLTKVKEVSLGDTVKTIGKGAFSGDTALTDVKLSKGLETIENEAFIGCTSLAKVDIPNSTVTIGDKAFYNCETLKEITIPDSVKNIGTDVVKNTAKDIEIKTTDGSVAADYAEKIGAKSSAKSTATLKAEAEAKKKAEEEAKKKAEEEAKKKADEQAKKKTLKKGESFTVAGFTYKVTKASTNSKTIGTVTLTKAAKKNLKKATIATTVKYNGIKYKITAIGPNAFKGQKKLTSVTIGTNVTNIGANAFNGCASLKTVTIKSTKITKVGAGAFKGINKKATIKVPKAKKKAYTKLLKNKGQAKTVKIK